MAQRIIALVVLSLFLLACEAIDRPGSDHSLSATEIGDAVRQERDRLLDSLTVDAVLYQKHDEINAGAVEGYPTHTISESWTIMDDEGEVGAIIVQSHDVDGNLLYNSIQTIEPEHYVFADLKVLFYAATSGEYPVWPLLENMWFIPLEVEARGLPVVGSGYLNGRPSTIFEHVEAGERPYRMEVELVNDSPLLHRMSIYEGSELASEVTLLEYHVTVPEGL